MALIITGPLAITGGLCATVGYVANSVIFDGTNDYLLLSSAIGGVDSPTALTSIWFKVDDVAGDGNLMIITDTTDGHFRVSRNALDQIEINLENNASTVLWNFTSTNTFNSTTNTGWHHLLFSTDFGGSPTATVYLDDAVLAGTNNTSPTTGSIDFTPAAWSFGADVSGNNKLTGSLSDIYTHTEILDINVELNRRKFFNSAGKAVFLGTDGSIPTSTTPLIFLSGDTAVWEVNKGSGDGFTLIGFIETGTTPDVPVGEEEAPVNFTSGSLFTFGFDGTFGLMGIGTTSTDISSPTQIGALTTWISADVGEDHSVALKADNTLWAWGHGVDGALGNGFPYNYSTPVQVNGTWNAAAAGQEHTLGIKTDGTLWAWGNNNSGELGDGTFVKKSAPVNIDVGSWLLVSTGSNHSSGIKADNSLWMWGYNGKGQLGQGDTIIRDVPTQVSGSWAHVSGGQYRAVAIRTDGTLWSWGKDGFTGSLGLGTTFTDKLFPAQVGSDTDWYKVYANQHYSTLALKTDGSLWAWGYNAYSSGGMLGVGDLVNHNSPVQVGNDTNWAKVSLGFQHGMGIRTDGTLWTWGDGYRGALGNEDAGGGVQYNKRVSVPVQIGSDENWALVNGGGEITATRSLAIRDTTG